MVKNIKKNTPKRPKPIRINDTYTLRCIRGPHKDNPNLFYFKLAYREGKTDKHAYCEWATVPEAVARAKIYAETEQQAVSGSFAECAEVWLEHVRTRKKKPIKETTFFGYKYAVKALQDAFGKLPISSLTEEIVITYRDTSIPDKIAATTWNNLVTTGNQIWIHSGGDPQKNPFRGTKVTDPETKKKKNTPVSEEDVNRLINHANGWRKCMLMLARYTGARVGELTSLTWDRVCFDNETVTVIDSKHTKKNGPIKYRTIPMLPPLKDFLLEWQEEAKPTSKSQTVTGRSIKYARHINMWLGEACNDLGLPKFTIHSFRRYVVRDFRRNGVSVEIAAKALGHSAITLLRTYRQVDTEDIKNALDIAYNNVDESLKEEINRLREENESLKDEVMRLQRKLLKLLSD